MLINQVGYDAEKEKRFLVQSRGAHGPETYSVVDDGGAACLDGPLADGGEIGKWGFHYWIGDFSELSEEGTFRIRVGKGAQVVWSHPFRIGRDLLFEETGELAQRFFYYQRCGTRIESWHEACHMDDGRLPNGSHLDVTGGWHDAGDYNKYNGFTPLSVFALIYAYENRRDYYDRFTTQSGRPTILDEALWGAEWLHKMHSRPGQLLDRVFSGYSYWGPPEGETDNAPANDDDRPIVGVAGPTASALAAASFAKLSAYVREEDRYLRAARDLWSSARNAGGSLESDAALLLTDEALFRRTGKSLYLSDASNRLAAIGRAQRDDGCLVTASGQPYYSITILGFPVACLADFGIRQPSVAGTEEAEVVSRYLAFSIRIAGNPFELSTIRSPDSRTTFFYRYASKDAWYVGQNSQYLS